ncbi:hypothetical protein C8R44DRAFT_825960 [Mycena epipterygia]|nr:hypothetical protein C8R44DRAFT_825960 [Mycena epipterygia]
MAFHAVTPSHTRLLSPPPHTLNTMLPQPLLLLTFAFGAWAASSSSASRSASASVSAGGASSSSAIGTPTNSAELPSLSGVSTCVVTCLGEAAGAATCSSEVAVDCFCPNPQNYTSTFVACLTACPSEVVSAEALVEQFCAAASKPTSLSFPSFTPSSTSASVSASAPSSSGSKSSVASPSATAPASSSASVSPSASTGAAGAVRLPSLGGLLVSAAGVLLGAMMVR